MNTWDLIFKAYVITRLSTSFTGGVSRRVYEMQEQFEYVQRSDEAKPEAA
jgi:hypothetical protein